MSLRTWLSSLILTATLLTGRSPADEPKAPPAKESPEKAKARVEVVFCLDTTGSMSGLIDAANLVTQGFTASEVFEHYVAMKPGLGWLHIKDYRLPRAAKRKNHVDEDAHARQSRDAGRDRAAPLLDPVHHLPRLDRPPGCCAR